MTKDINKICIIGAGCWGTALAHLLCHPQTQVSLVSATGRSLKEMKETLFHPKLPLKLNERIRFEDNVTQAAKNADLIFLAVKSAHLKETARKLSPEIRDVPIISLTKGLDSETGETMCEILEKDFDKVAALSGGSHAEEVIQGLPFTLTLGLPKKEVQIKGMSFLDYVLNLFSGTQASIDVSEDRRGVEVAAAVKNVVAIAAGIADGLSLGDNFRSSLITKGLSEVAMLGQSLDCRLETFYGYAGLGDLLATALSEHSRNRKFGLALGRGLSVEEAKKNVGTVVEGLDALEGIMRLEEKYGLKLTLPHVVEDIVRGNRSPERIKDVIRRIHS